MLTGLVLWFVLVSVAGASAQIETALVIEATPIYLTPDDTRTPLKILPVNTALRIVGEKGDWIQVEFRDPQYGPRVGFVARSKVRIRTTQPQPPVDPPVPESPRRGADPQAGPGNPDAGRSRALGLKAYGTYGSSSLAATETFDAAAGTSRFSNVGGGIVLTDVWRSVFIDVGVSQAGIDGHRVFIDGDTVYDLGIPLSVTVRPVDVAAGWRVTSGRLSTLVGGGLTSVYYEETSAFADDEENVTQRRAGPLLLAGIDVALARWLEVGGEVRYRAVKGILGEGGVSSAFGEDRLGGFAAGLRISVGK